MKKTSEIKDSPIKRINLLIMFSIRSKKLRKTVRNVLKNGGGSRDAITTLMPLLNRGVRKGRVIPTYFRAYRMPQQQYIGEASWGEH
jgi:hypothetical protein